MYTNSNRSFYWMLDWTNEEFFKRLKETEIIWSINIVNINIMTLRNQTLSVTYEMNRFNSFRHFFKFEKVQYVKKPYFSYFFQRCAERKKSGRGAVQMWISRPSQEKLKRCVLKKNSNISYYTKPQIFKSEEIRTPLFPSWAHTWFLLVIIESETHSKNI